jgi:hypothetical protein
MNRLLHLKHWQLFLLFFGIPIILQLIFMVRIVTSHNPGVGFFMFPLIMVVYMGLFFGWFYALGTNLHKKLPPTIHMNLKIFKLFMLVPVLYIFTLAVFMFSLFSRLIAHHSSFNPGWMGLIVPIHLFSMFCIFYCLYFNAKSLKAVEWQRPVTFSDFAGEFFLIWFFPVGIWIIQPRINKLFEEAE